MHPRNQKKLSSNQIPLVNLIIPVFYNKDELGLVTITKQGRLMLPGGYIESGTDWQEVCLKIARYEARIRMEDGTRFWPFDCFTSNHKAIFLLFARAPLVRAEDLLKWRRKEGSRVVLREPAQMAFSHHTEIVKRFFG